MFNSNFIFGLKFDKIHTSGKAIIHGMAFCKGKWIRLKFYIWIVHPNTNKLSQESGS